MGKEGLMRKGILVILGFGLGIVAVVLWRCQQVPPQVVQATAPAPVVDLKIDAAPPDAAPIAMVPDAAQQVVAKEPAPTRVKPILGHGTKPVPYGIKGDVPNEPAPAQAAGPPPEQPAPSPPPPDAAPVIVVQKPDAEPLEKPPAPVERKKGTVVLRHHNGMSSSFHLVRIADLVDGAPVFERTAPSGGSLDEPRDLDSPALHMTPGQHTMSVRLEYTAASRGVFTYAEGYRFRVTGNFTFTINPDRTTEVVIKGYEKGGALTQLADKPAVEFQSKSR
jgi:hypothetical protein